jgi:NAD(P)-dependent dehydrogenase (short-subunit alcohol dehydrogenase family)
MSNHSLIHSSDTQEEMSDEESLAGNGQRQWPWTRHHRSSPCGRSQCGSRSTPAPRARRPAKQYGEHITPVSLDVREAAAAQAAVQAAVDTYGRLDVLVNNAYGQAAPFEQMDPEGFKEVIDTCLYGVVYLTRAALPVMRRQKSGHIFQVSSIGGRLAMPGNAVYHAAKWAVGGLSDSIAAEVSPFGVKVCTLEPGGIRTNFAQRAGAKPVELLPEYQASVGPMYKLLKAVAGTAEGDPRRIAEVILRLSHSDEDSRRRRRKVGADRGRSASERSRRLAGDNPLDRVFRCPAGANGIKPPAEVVVTSGPMDLRQETRMPRLLTGTAQDRRRPATCPAQPGPAVG